MLPDETLRGARLFFGAGNEGREAGGSDTTHRVYRRWAGSATWRPEGSRLDFRAHARSLPQQTSAGSLTLCANDLTLPPG
jgi:hypothetical protein